MWENTRETQSLRSPFRPTDDQFLCATFKEKIKYKCAQEFGEFSILVDNQTFIQVYEQDVKQIQLWSDIAPLDNK